MKQQVDIALLHKDIAEFTKGDVVVGGFVRTIRDSKALGFIDLNDGTSFKGIQVVFEEGKVSNYNEVTKLNVGSAIQVTGTVVLTPGAKQPYEVHAKEIIVIGASSPEYPLQKKRHSMEYLRTIAHLRPRANTFRAVFRVRSVAAFALHKFFNERGFIYAHTPLITGSDCEGAGEMFQVTTLDINDPPRNEDRSIDYKADFFGKATSLTVSGQLEG
ncbi:OB-fold nucleic acid binding domain-containing protein, partial [Akkermansia muciniphila]|uniref:OB-fold nucleic acid binding domain-containing protein n=1 Tax=Akkermansia muciniphila TaxID=239935 RepID=UPI001259509E